MVSEEVHELVVRMKPEGIDETERDLEGAEEQFDETASSVGASSQEMEQFATRWQGAMTAIMAGFAVAATGLLSQVPVIGELMGGLAEIISAVAFQMDDVLRPVLQPMTDRFFDVAGAIFEADGALGTFIGVVGTAIAVIGTIAGVVLAWAAAKGTLVAAGAAVVSAMGPVITVIGAVASAIAGLISLPALVAAALALLVAAFVLDWGGIRTTTVDAISSILSWISDLVSDGFEWLADRVGSLTGNIVTDVWSFSSSVVDAIDDLIARVASALGGLLADMWDFGADIVGNLASAMRNAFDRVGDVLASLSDRFASAFGDLTSDAHGWGRDIIDRFIKGLRSAFDRLDNAIDDARGKIDDALSFDIRENDRMAERWGWDLMDHMSVGIEQGARERLPDTEDVISGGNSAPAFTASRDKRIAIMLDGKRVDEGTREFSDDETNLRGRFG